MKGENAFMIETNLKIGLALGGGAFRGLAHIGVLQVMEEYGVPIHMIAGTSMGALVGGVYCSGMNMHLVERYVYTIEERDLIDMTIPRTGFIAGQRIELLIKTLTGNRSFQDLKIPFAAVAADVEKGQPVVLTEGKVYEAIRASISIPGVFKPVMWDGRMLVDGGIVARVPTDTVRDMGADFVISVDVGYHGGETKCDGIVSIMMQAFAVMEWHIIKERVNTSDINIVPALGHINMASIAQAEETIEIGRQAARAQIPGILQALQDRGAKLLDSQ